MIRTGWKSLSWNLGVGRVVDRNSLGAAQEQWLADACPCAPGSTLSVSSCGASLARIRTSSLVPDSDRTEAVLRCISFSFPCCRSVSHDVHLLMNGLGDSIPMNAALKSGKRTPLA